MDKKIKRFDDTEIEEYDVHQYKKISDIDINEVVVYNKFHFGKKDFKYFIGYKDNKEIRHLCMFSPETSIYKR